MLLAPGGDGLGEASMQPYSTQDPKTTTRPPVEPNIKKPEATMHVAT